MWKITPGGENAYTLKCNFSPKNFQRNSRFHFLYLLFIAKPLVPMVFQTKNIVKALIPIDVFQLFIYWQTVPFIRACLCYFFSQTVLIFGMQTRSACATTNFLNVNIHSLCNCAFFGLCICTACGASTVCCMCN